MTIFLTHLYTKYSNYQCYYEPSLLSIDTLDLTLQQKMNA